MLLIVYPPPIEVLGYWTAPGSTHLSRMGAECFLVVASESQGWERWPRMYPFAVITQSPVQSCFPAQWVRHTIYYRVSEFQLLPFLLCIWTLETAQEISACSEGDWVSAFEENKTWTGRFWVLKSHRQRSIWWGAACSEERYGPRVCHENTP